LLTWLPLIFLAHSLRKSVRSGFLEDAAAFYLTVNDKQRALDALKAAFDEHVVTMIYLVADPTFKILHGDPRFERLVSRMNLTHVKR
jgi:hypothetical protein